MFAEIVFPARCFLNNRENEEQIADSWLAVASTTKQVLLANN